MILHNMKVRVQQNGDVRDDAAGKDLVTEFHDVEQDAANESRSELQKNVATMTSQTMDDEGEEGERMLVM